MSAEKQQRKKVVRLGLVLCPAPGIEDVYSLKQINLRRGYLCLR